MYITIDADVKICMYIYIIYYKYYKYHIRVYTQGISVCHISIHTGGPDVDAGPCLGTHFTYALYAATKSLEDS